MFSWQGLKSNKFLLGTIFSGLLLTAGCGADGAGDPGTDLAPTQRGTYRLADSEYTRNIEIFDNVKRLDDRAAAVAHLAPTQVAFPASVADILAQYEPGDIMATSAGNGLLRRVEAIEFIDEQIIVHTSPADLGDVFASGEIYFARHAEPNLQVPESFRTYRGELDVDGMRVAEQALSGDWSGSLFSWNRDFAGWLNNKIASDHIIVEQASLNFDVGAEFYGDVEFKFGLPPVDLKTLRVGANGQANATLRVRLESADEFHFAKTYVLLSSYDEDAALSLPIKPISILGLVQLQFGARATLDLKADLEGTVAATGEVQLNGNLGAGVERKSGTWQTFYTSGFSPSGYGPDFSGEKSFSAQAKLTTEVSATISDTLTGKLTVQPAIVTVDLSQQIDADSGACPYFFNVNVTGKASGILESVKVPLAGNVSIMSSPSNWTLYDENFLTQSGQLPLPGICDPEYVVPEFGNGARAENHSCQRDLDCRGELTCYRNTCVHKGPIRFSIAWFEDSDLDLEVVTPNGEVVNWLNFAAPSADGLIYDFPQCTGKCFGSGPYVESIYSDSPAQPGTYLVRVTVFENRLGEGRPGDFELLIDDGGKITTEGGSFANAVETGNGSGGYAVEFEYTVD